jgi:hypothetical protein
LSVRSKETESISTFSRRWVLPVVEMSKCDVAPSSYIAFLFALQAFNYISNKGYARMSREDEKHWVDLMNVIHDSVKGGMKYNTGTLLMVLSRPVNLDAVPSAEKGDKTGPKAKTPSKEGKVNP